MVTTGARPPRDTHPTAPPNVAYWVQFRRGPNYQGEYGFDWVEWTRNSANNSTTDFDDLVLVTGTPIGDFVECFDPGVPGIPAQPGTPGQPLPAAPPAPAPPPPAQPNDPLQPIAVAVALPPPLPPPATMPIPAKPGIMPRYAPVTGPFKQDYHQKLHKDYYKRTVQSNDYYAPWCSMRPHQTIRLQLKVEFLNGNAVQPSNWFTVVPDTNYLVTINNKPSTGPMNLVPKDQQVLDVTIECLHPAPETRLQVVDELNTPVGELTMAENLYVYELPVRVVYVLLGKPMNPKDPLGATPPRPLYAPGRHTQATLQQDFEALDFITYVNKQTLNQALITCVLKAPTPPPLVSTTTPTTAPTTPSPATTSPATASPSPAPAGLAPAYQVLLDEDQLKQDGLLRNGLLRNSPDVTSYCEKMANATPSVGPFAGLTIFVHELNVPPPTPTSVVTASGTIFPVEAKTLNVYRVGLSAGSKCTIAHELGHVLGLMHSFPDVDDGEATLYGEALDNSQKQLAKEQTTIKQLTQPVDIQKAQIGIQNLNTQIVNLKLHLDVHKNNAFKFTKFSTENMMDYESGKTRLFYWQWQWLLLQADVVKYYGTKTAAR